MSSPLRFVRLTGCALALATVAACNLPPDYAPDYVQMPVVGPDHRLRTALVPEACLIPDPTDKQLGPRLPPGCANNANLVAMAERKGDLVEGRRLGPAPAAPAARAAQKYIYAKPAPPAPQNPLGGGSDTEPSPAAPTASIETVPPIAAGGGGGRR